MTNFEVEIKGMNVAKKKLSSMPRSKLEKVALNATYDSVMNSVLILEMKRSVDEALKYLNAGQLNKCLNELQEIKAALKQIEAH